jgi:hypothetical protein
MILLLRVFYILVDADESESVNSTTDYLGPSVEEFVSLLLLVLSNDIDC